MEQKKVLTNAFGWLSVGLLLAFVTAFVTTLNQNVMRIVFGTLGGYSYLIFVAAMLLFVILFQVLIRKIPPIVAKILYIFYCCFTGLSLAGVFIVYTLTSIMYVFLATAICFAVFALIGRFTKTDLTSWGVYLFMALIAILVLEVINIFVMNHTLNMILCIAGVLLFCAYIAYDVQKALDKSFMMDTPNKGIYCAFQLFIDFINLFLDLLRLFGKTRD